MTSNESNSLLSLKGDYPFLLKNQSKYRWWKPILAALFSAFIYIVLVVVTNIVIYFISGQDPQVQAAISPATNGEYIGGDLNDPFVLLATFIPIAVGIPSVALGMRALGLGKLGVLSSTEGKLRWERFIHYAPLTFCAGVAITVIETAISVAMGNPLGECTIVPIALITIIIVCPFQCAAEEYVFRGFLFQSFSSWIPIVALPLLIQTFLFALCHGYNSIGLVCVAVTGLCAGWLAIKTGGLEASICLHSVNNVISFGLGSLFVTQTTKSVVGIVDLIAYLILILTITALLYAISKRKGYLQD